MNARSVEYGYIAFGANLGDRAATFAHVCAALPEHGIRLLRTSPLYETAPWGGVEGGPFLNAVFEVRREVEPDIALHILQEIENRFGRQRPRAQAARTCDLDILLWGNTIFSTSTLTVPHPRFHLRKFTLIPLCDLVPDLAHPLLRKSFQCLLDECTDSLDVTRVPLEKAVP